MTIQVTGILKDPLGQLSIGTTIRVISQENLGETLECLVASVVTDGVGGYDFQLVDGTHTIEVNFSKKYCLVGTVIVDGATPSPLSLPALLNL